MPQQIKEVEVADLELDRPPPHQPASTNEGWLPDLNPTQWKIFDDPSWFILAHSEKASGKGICMAHKFLRHAYENRNALVLVISPSIRTGNEGIWHDFLTLVLPAWKDGFGLEHSDSKLDPNTKDRHIWIGNRFGGWSKILLVSIPHASMVESRVKGPTPSFVYIDELTECDSDKYLTFLSAQLGRRRNIDGPQQFTASCNPKGPSHWVFKTFFVDCVNQDTGVRDPRYAEYHVPIQENVHRLPPGYVERLYTTFRNDPIQLRRLMHGEWIDVPSGDAIFGEDFSAERHFIGDANKRLFLHPVKNYPIDISLDPGPVNFCVTFEQALPTSDGKVVTLVIDELNYVGKPTKYKTIVADILKRTEFWNEVEDHEFIYEYTADEAAFNQIRGDGKYDYITLQDFSRGEDGWPRMLLKACPKGADSVEARIRMIQTMLQEGELFISAKCPKIKEMFEHLESAKVKEGEYDPKAGYKPVRSIYIHPFDSLSYGIFRRRVRGAVPSTEQAITPQVYAMGVR